MRIRDKHITGSFYDHLAGMIFEVIFSASAVNSPKDQCWWIQHNAIWSELFNFRSLNGNSAKIVKFKVRRLIYNDILEMNKFPNFKGAKILAFCLNVMGFTISKEDSYQDSKALQKVVLSWTKKNFAWLYTYNPRIAAACLVDGITYDEDQLKLVKTYPAEGLRRDTKRIYFEVDSPPDAEPSTK